MKAQQTTLTKNKRAKARSRAAIGSPSPTRVQSVIAPLKPVKHKKRQLDQDAEVAS